MIEFNVGDYIVRRECCLDHEPTLEEVLQYAIAWEGTVIGRRNSYNIVRVEDNKGWTDVKEGEYNNYFADFFTKEEVANGAAIFMNRREYMSDGFLKITPSKDGILMALIQGIPVPNKLFDNILEKE